MPMNWEHFLNDYRINFVTRGPNTRRGEVSIKCPWCGEDDPSEHLGINLSKEAWGCHRNAQHRGKAPHRLIKALLSCSQGQAELILQQYDASDPDSLDDLTLNPVEHKALTEDLSQFDDFISLESETSSNQRFLDYLKNRGFEKPTFLAATYNLKCCITGRWKDRLIIPIYRNAELIAWTGRALQNPVLAPRYLSTSNVIKTTVFNEDVVLHGGKVLVVAEGPFDALKLDYFSNGTGAIGTCLFGTSITIDQISILRQASSKYERVVFFLDADAIESSFMATDWLPAAKIGMLPEGVKDPGDLSLGQVRSLLAPYLI